MSIFHRKLFTHTPYHHYGTGIASGLVERQGFAVGGRVKLSKGGDPSLEDIRKQSTARDSIKEFQGEARQTLKMAISDSIYSDFIQNFSNLGDFDKPGLADYYSSKVTEVFNQLPEEILQSLTEQDKQDILARYDEVIDEISATDARGNNKFIASGKIPMITNSIKRRENDLTQFSEKYKGKLSGLVDIVQNTEKDGPSPDATDTTGTEGSDTKTVTDAGVSAPTTDVTGIKGAITSDEGRQSFVKYLKDLQEETELMEKARRAAIQDSFIAAGSVDYDGDMMKSLSLAFQDPMKELRDREYAQGEDIYTTVRDQATGDLERPDMQKIIELAQGSPDFLSAAKDIYGSQDINIGDAPLDASDYQTYYEIADKFSDSEIAGLFGISKEKAKANRGILVDQLAKNKNRVPTKIDLGGKDLAKGTLTEPTISRPTIADGGRIGFQEGGQTEEQPVENVQGMQEDVQTTYAALRQSLPDYISDNVVTLLSEDAKALAEFVEIQTYSQIKDFEDKYRVELNFPQEEETTNFPESEMI